MDRGSEFQDLVRNYLDFLYNYALVLTRQVEAAEDLLQESLVRAYDGFHTFQPISRFTLTSALSDNPWIAFRPRAPGEDLLRVVLANNRG